MPITKSEEMCLQPAFKTECHTGVLGIGAQRKPCFHAVSRAEPQELEHLLCAGEKGFSLGLLGPRTEPLAA